MRAPPAVHVRESPAALPFALCQRVLALPVPVLVQAALMAPDWPAWGVPRAPLVLAQESPPAQAVGRAPALPVVTSGSSPPAGEVDAVAGARTLPGADEEPPDSMGGPRPGECMPAGAGGWGAGQEWARAPGTPCRSTLHCQWASSASLARSGRAAAAGYALLLLALAKGPPLPARAVGSALTTAQGWGDDGGGGDEGGSDPSSCR